MTLAEQIRALQLGLPVGGTAHAALDRAAELAEAHDSALVAAAYEAMASRFDEAEAEDIRAMTDADALAALDRIKREAHRAGMREAASRIMAVAKSLPVQHESKERGKCTYNWARWAESIILRAAEEAGK